MLAEVRLFQAVSQRKRLNTTKGIGLRDFMMLQDIANLSKELKAIMLLRDLR